MCEQVEVTSSEVGVTGGRDLDQLDARDTRPNPDVWLSLIHGFISTSTSRNRRTC